MALNRLMYNYLIDWKQRTDRMPMLLQGARQVGKTTLVRQLGESYDAYLEFNIERPKDRQPFAQYQDIDELVAALFLQKGIAYSDKKQYLIFIDEIQEHAPTINMLRYFYEDYPHLHVIASGSLLDFALSGGVNVPVGRVEYAVLHPMNFEEYLMALGNEALLSAYHEIPTSEVATPLLFEEYHRYTLIGGMPKVVNSYLQHRDISRLKNIYSGLLRGYQDDVQKYARNTTQTNVIRHIIKVAPALADQRVKFQKFGGSEYRAREVGDAFRALQKARILSLVYPTVETLPPVIPDFGKRPRLQFLDTGLINYSAGLQLELLGISDLNNTSRGRTIQHITYQEVKSYQRAPDYQNAFWVRQERRSQAEVDLAYSYGQYLIPIEVKSGATGKLRSLHEYMDRCEHHYAVRFYKGPIRVDELTTRLGKKYLLQSLPYFLIGKLENYLDLFLTKH